MSAIPWKEASVNNCAKAGTLETLKSVINKFEFVTSLVIVEVYSNFPSSILNNGQTYISKIKMKLRNDFL